MKFMLMVIALIELSFICNAEIISKNGSTNQENNYYWADVSAKDCFSGGGEKMSMGVCTATWQNAKNICTSIGGRLPGIEELRRVVTDCGGKIAFNSNNNENKDYQSCYYNKGFASDIYWSSTVYKGHANEAWSLSVNGGFDGPDLKESVSLVRCLKSEK